MPDGADDWNTEISQEMGVEVGKEGLWNSQEMGAEYREGCSKHSAVELRVRLGNQIWMKRGKGKDLQSVYLLPWQDPKLR